MNREHLSSHFTKVLGEFLSVQEQSDEPERAAKRQLVQAGIPPKTAQRWIEIASGDSVDPVVPRLDHALAFAGLRKQPLLWLLPPGALEDQLELGAAAPDGLLSRVELLVRDSRAQWLKQQSRIEEIASGITEVARKAITVHLDALEESGLPGISDGSTKKLEAQSSVTRLFVRSLEYGISGGPFHMLMRNNIRAQGSYDIVLAQQSGDDPQITDDEARNYRADLLRPGASGRGGVPASENRVVLRRATIPHTSAFGVYEFSGGRLDLSWTAGVPSIEQSVRQSLLIRNDVAHLGIFLSHGMGSIYTILMSPEMCQCALDTFDYLADRSELIR